MQRISDLALPGRLVGYEVCRKLSAEQRSGRLRAGI